MRRIVFASHHRFASGMKDVVEFMAGPRDISVVEAYVDGAKPEDQVAQAMGGIAPEDEVLVLTDVAQGSVNQLFLPYLANNVFVVSGVNVPLAVELVLESAPYSAEGIRRCVDAARDQIVFMNDQEVEVGEDDE